MDELRAARILAPGNDRVPRLSRIFDDDAAPFLCLARAQKGPPYDIVTRRGSLTSDLPARLMFRRRL